MYLDSLIEGKYVDLRSVDVGDAEFTMDLRNDPELGKHFPKFDNSLEQQIQWIKKQRDAEDDYFWIMQDKRGNPFGTIGVYDIHRDEPKGRSLIAKGNPLQNIEGFYLAFHYALDTLEAKGIYGYVYNENTRALRFNELVGAIISEPTEFDGRTVRKTLFKNPEFEDNWNKIKGRIYR